MRFILTAILIAAILTFSLRFVEQPTLNVPVAKHLVNVPEITPQNLALAIDHPRSDVRATILYVYTSWCPFCKMQRATMERLAQNQGPNGLQLIGLSFDKHAEEMEEHLSRLPKSAFTTFWIDNKLAVANGLRSKGANFDGGIPYIALLDTKGNLLEQYHGVTGLDVLEKNLKPLLPVDKYHVQVKR